MTLTRWLPGADEEADGPLPRADVEDYAHLTAPDEDDPWARTPSPALPVSWALSGCAGFLRKAGLELRRLSREHRVAGVARIARSWLDPMDEHRREAIERLPVEMSTTAAAVEWALDTTFESWTSEGLSAWIERAGSDARDSSVGLTGHVWAGNVFTSGLPPVVASLVSGIPALIKAPGSTPTFAALFARSVAANAPELGPCVGAAGWSRADERATRVLLTADAVFAYGDDASLDAIERLGGRTLHRFGHRISIAAAEDDATDDALRGLVDDVFAYEGVGCLTPRWLFVKGDSRALAKRLESALKAGIDRWGAPSTALASDRMRWEGACGFGGWARLGRGWGIAMAPLNLSVPPPARCLQVVAVDSWGEACEVLSPLGARVQGCAWLGVDAPPPDLVDALTPLGASRVVPAGRLQRPPVDWIHDDVDPLFILGG